MNAGNLFQLIDVALRLGAADVKDPGSGGTITINNKGMAICLVTTAGAESRILNAASELPINQRILVILVTAGGALTIDSDDSDVILSSAGDVAEFVVSFNGTSKVWKTVQSSTGVANAVTRATAAAGAGLIPVSSGANRAIGAATPAALGVVDINTGDAATDTAIIALANALQTFGLVTHTWT
jgi:hypothetical protein